MDASQTDDNELAREILEDIEEADDPEEYRSYRDQLYGLGTDVIPLLRRELKSWHYRRRMAAATNLGRLGDVHSVPDLVELLDDPQAEVREMALFALGILGDESVVEPVRGCLEDYDADVRYRALIALKDLGCENLETLLIKCLGEDDAFGVREQALSLLQKEGSPRAVPTILRCFLENEKEMQQMAEEALDRLVPHMDRRHYEMVRDELSARERRLVLNYLENKKLQKVYRTLATYLARAQPAEATETELGEYGRPLASEEERAFLDRAYGRDETVDLLVDHVADSQARRSLLLVGEAGVGKTAMIHECARRLRELDDDWQVLETNTSELISGTRYLGDWETKLKEMTEAILEREKVVLYLTNPNDLLGAGAHSKSDENFADFFKPYLHRGQLTIVAETTEEELKNGLSSNPGFLRLFRQVSVSPMSSKETIDVLDRRLDEFEVRGERSVTADQSCLEDLVDFARSFYTRSEPPGRACDLQDALVDYAGRHAPEDQDPVVLSGEEIPACLSEETGISLDLIDKNVPLDLEQTHDWFTDRLIDQEPAVDAIVDRMAMIKAGMADPTSPHGVYFLVGPTGVGKTFFAELVAERIFGDRDRAARFDLSEYQGRYAVEKLIGSPHDDDREGLLTEEVRNQPFSVLLFDEFEKADPQVFHLFLQLLDDGRLTDAHGRTTDFRQTFIFLTSNLGASKTSIAPMGFDAGSGDQARAGHIRSGLDEFFAPEFLNRLDDILVFTPLSAGAMEELVEVEIERFTERRGFERRDLTVETTAAARELLEERGFSEKFGARELKRTIERDVLTPISRRLVSEPGPHDGKLIAIDAREGELTYELSSHPPRTGTATPEESPDEQHRRPRSPRD